MNFRNVLFIFTLVILLITGCSNKESSGQEIGDKGDVNLEVQNGTTEASQTTQAEKVNKGNVSLKPIVLYDLSDELFEKPFTEIPYYTRGKIEFLDEVTVLQHQEGHQPWLADPFSVTVALCNNIIPIDVPFDEINEKMGSLYKMSQPSITTSNGIEILKKEDDLMEISVPNYGKYELSFKTKYESDMHFMYLQKIKFYPENSQD